VVGSASNRNESQEYFLGSKGSQCIGLTTLPPSCADWKSGGLTLLELSGPVQGLLCCTLSTTLRNMESGVIELCIYTVGIGWRRVLSCTAKPSYLQGQSPHWPLGKRLGWLQQWSRSCGEEKNFFPVMGN